MKNKDIRKDQSGHQHKTHNSEPQENLKTTTVKYGENKYLIDHDEYSAVVRLAGDKAILGLFKAATRVWKTNDLPLYVQTEVENLYT